MLERKKEKVMDLQLSNYENSLVIKDGGKFLVYVINSDPITISAEVAGRLEATLVRKELPRILSIRDSDGDVHLIKASHISRVSPEPTRYT